MNATWCTAMHACTYTRTRTHVRTQARTHALLHARTASGTHARTHSFMHSCTHSCTHLLISTLLNAHMQACVRDTRARASLARTHTPRALTHAHTHSHTRTPLHACTQAHDKTVVVWLVALVSECIMPTIIIAAFSRAKLRRSASGYGDAQHAHTHACKYISVCVQQCIRTHACLHTNAS